MHRCVRQVKLSKPVDVTEPEGGADSYHCVCYSVRIFISSGGFNWVSPSAFNCSGYGYG